MQLLLKDRPLLTIHDNGTCEIIDFDHLPFALRRDPVTFVEFIEWASSRTLSMGRSYAKEILNALRLSQTNRYAVCRACRGLSLEDSYWLRQEDDCQTWETVNLFRNPLSLFITELSLSGRNIHYVKNAGEPGNIHTPELTTLGASAKGWVRRNGQLYLHKVGRYEIPADQILEALSIPHIHYQVSSDEEIHSYLSQERKEWITGVGDAVVHSRLHTTEDTAMVTFEEFKIFCGFYGLNPYSEAAGIDRKFYLQMQIADYLLNNNDRHDQNWGFLMDNQTGKLTGYFPLFDHDHAFCENPRIYSQTTETPVFLRDAAIEAQRELHMDLSGLNNLECPAYLTNNQWEQVLMRREVLMRL